ncbi:MAG TPA: sugar phosphate isomerase/epimerase family protein [Acidisarcina sp.]|nr:sugar phosphate isomerase/epimerase family protein [Acidisarcina sp.]
MSDFTRRNFLIGAGVAAAAAGIPASLRAMDSASGASQAQRLKSQFRLAVITDEISQDFDHACSIAAREFGMSWVELRGLWKKNVLALDANEIAEARRILAKYELRVTDIGSPLFKTDWPDAPQSKFSPKHDKFSPDVTFKGQDEVLEQSIAAAKAFQTDRIRGFDFWRLEDPAPHRKAINAKLQEAAEKCGKQGLIFVLENEMACNTATGAEAAKVLAAVPSPHLMLNWDPGNAAALGETPFPNGWNLLPKNRIGHCHCKDTVMKPGGGYEWAPVGKGVIDWKGQFRALKQMGYNHAISLETHWHGGGTGEESTRQSWAGMKIALQSAGMLA